MRRCCFPRLDSRCSARAKYLKYFSAGVAELVDAPDSKSGSGNRVWVRFPPPAPRSTIALVLQQSVVELEPRLHPGCEQVAVGLEPRRVVERAGLDGDVLGVDVEFLQERRAAAGAEVPVDRLAGIARTRVSPERARNLQRRSVDRLSIPQYTLSVPASTDGMRSSSGAPTSVTPRRPLASCPGCVPVFPLHGHP